MAEIKWLADTALQTLNDPNTSLTDGSRWSFDYDNGTELDLYMFLYVLIQYDTTAPSAGIPVLDVYVMPGDGEGTEVFPFDSATIVPQKIWYQGSLETRNPSTSTDETLGMVVQLYPDGNRFHLDNVSGQTISLERIAYGKPWKFQSV